jgi:hypothetical protein
MSAVHRTRTVVAALLLLVAVAAVACSRSSPGTSSAPSGTTGGTPAQVAGNWSGTLAAAGFGPQSITLIAVQGGNCVDGAWRASGSDWSGAISGYADVGSFSGQVTIQGTSAGQCSGVATFSGEVTASTIHWTSSGFTGSCPGGLPQNATIDLRRD